MTDGMRVAHASRHPYLDPEGWCREVTDPQLGQHGPPTLVRLPYGVEGWLTTRYHDVRTVLSDRRFCRAPTTRLDSPRMTRSANSRVMLIAVSDPPDHPRLRRLFNPPFNAAGAERLRPRVEELIKAQLDQLPESSGSADLVHQLFDPLTLTLSGEILGVPAEDRSTVLEWLGAFQSTSLPLDEFHRRIDAAGAYFDDLVHDRGRCPGHDAISGAVLMREQRRDETTDADVASLAMGLFITGVENLSGQLQTSIHALLDHPGQWRRLRAEPELIPQAAQELMRYAPVTIGPARARYVVEDVEVGGVRLPAGSLAIPAVAAAGFDGSVFRDPYRLDLSRKGVPVPVFGFGIHFCQAAQLNRAVMITALSIMLERFPDLRLAVANEQLRWKPGRRIRGLEELPVSW